ncbi:uncharacterized protein OCT59_007652 [Rhizophagus irregularis]|nr:hypothetical protein OCT59_007652 [Rhizophagus irregularis]GBC33507.1 hypothetical protein GLOIN_2v1766278 [Rhizophagus irregularis DAOM 181602=DAOM 197198]
MSRNLARRGGGSYNPNSNKAARQEKKNNKKQLSDNSGSDSDNNSQKRSRILTKDSMDEDYEDFVADAPADGGLVGSTSTAIPQQNNSRSTAQENTQASTPNNSAAPTAPGQDASSGANASIHAPRNKENNSSPNASPNMDVNDGTSPDQAVDPSPTITINRQDFLAAAAPNSAPQTLEKLKTNKAIIDAVNNLFLETYESYTGRARMTGSGDAKRLIIHFHTAEARDLCVESTHSDFPDLQFHLYDPKQLRSDEDLRAIQVTDILFFITKPQLQSYFKKFGNLLALHLYSRKGAKMQQARIVYDHADAISRFTTQWAVYCFSTCLRVTPCHYSLEQKAARRAFVAVLSGLPANTKDIHLAPLVKEHGAKAINIPLSLNSYKPKPWAYVTFNSQETMDAAMEQTIGFQGRTLRWGTSNDSKALCHRCGKLGCAPTSCLLNQRRGRSRTRDPVAALKERFNIGQRPAQQRTPRNNSRSRSRSKSRDRSASAQRSNSNSNRSNNNNSNINAKPSSSSGSANSSSTAHGRTPSNNRKGKDRSVSFSSNARAPLPDPNSPNALEAALKILNVLTNLQQDVARVESRISNLELNNQQLSAIEAHLGINPPPAPVVNSEPDWMEEDPPESTGTLIPHPNAPLSSGAKNSSSPKSTPNNIPHSAPASVSNPSPQDELNSVIQDQKAIKDTLQSLTGSIQGFIASLGGSPSDRASAPSQ